MKRDAAITYSELSAPRRRLVDIIRLHGFGYVERLRVKDGEPVWDPPPELTSHTKLGRRNRPQSLHDPACSTVIDEYVHLFEEFDARKNFTVKRLQFQDGVPLFLEARVTIM